MMNECESEVAEEEGVENLMSLSPQIGVKDLRKRYPAVQVKKLLTRLLSSW